MDFNKIVALLPMKAHSERVKGKNFRLISGKPLYKWILDTLLSINRIDHIIINTDARSILNENGLEESSKVVIRDRIPALCGDTVSMNLILKDDIDNIDSDIYLMTHITNPLLSAEIIEKAIDVYINNLKLNNVDSLFSVTKYQTRFYKDDGTPVNHDPNNLIRTQDLEPWYEENSNIYLFTKSSFYKTQARIGLEPLLFEIPKIESIDIDDQQDFDIVEALLTKRHGIVK